MRGSLLLFLAAAGLFGLSGALAEEAPPDWSKADLESFAVALPSPQEAVRVEPSGWLFSDAADVEEYEPIPLDFASYDGATFFEHAGAIRWRLGAVVAGTVALGLADWDWGDSSFHFESEDFFGKNTKNGGMDKLGHAYGTYVLADFFTHSIRGNAADSTNAQISGALLAWGVMGTVEIMDGFAEEHGFAYEDIIMNTIGASFSILRNSVPGMREKLDFRLEYIPTGHEGFSPHSDYSGQKYVLALKLSGFEGLDETPLRFVELHAGYFARGFTSEEREDGDDKRREPYIAIGLNLSELLLSGEEVRRSRVGRIARRGLEYIQVPYTYIATEQD